LGWARRAMEWWGLGLLLVAAAPGSAFDAARCTEFTAKGYCNQEKTAKYMATHCTGYCSTTEVEEVKSESGDEDASCERWKESGYCEHEQYSEYMQRSCPKACGVAPVGGAANNDVYQMADAVEEEEMATGTFESEFDDTGIEIPDVTASPVEPAADAADNDNCAAWAKQGLCASDDYAQYMTQNCKRACADPAAAAAAAAASSHAVDPTPANCLMWAKRGMCGDSSDYKQFMEMNCAETCANIDDLLKGELPPSSVVPLLLAVGFIALMGYAGKEALQRDANRSAKLNKSLQKVGTQVGESPTIGPGRRAKATAKKETKVPASLRKKD